MKVYDIGHGIYQRGLFNKNPFARKEAFLDSLNIRMVVCLTATEDPDMTTLLGAEYVYLPIPDGRVTDARVLHDLAYRQANHIAAGRGVLNHCRAGRNRSALVSALTYREVTGCTGREARDHLQFVRPAALANPHFCDYLDALGHPS